MNADAWETARKVCTPRQYEVLELKHRHGMALRPIAAMLGVSVATVRDHLSRAEQKVALALAAEHEEAA